MRAFCSEEQLWHDATNAPEMPAHVDSQRASRPDEGMDWRFSCFARTRSLLSGVLSEICNFIHRMRFRRRAMRLEVTGVGSVVESDCHGKLQPNERLLACIRDMKDFSAAHPWATDFDRMLFRKAWMAGAKWADGANSSYGERG